MATNRRQREARDSRQADARAWASQPDQFESKVLKLPEGVEQYKLEVGRHEVDFMPWLVGKNNPRADEGFAYYMREYRAHEIPTPDGKKPRYCCRYDCFKKKCPACEFMNAGAGGDAELAKALKAKFRMLWLVNDTPGAKKVRWKVLEIFHFNMGKGFGELMKDAINSLPEGEQPFALEGGYSAILTVKEIAMPTSKYNGVTRIDFKKRGYDYPESLLEKAPCLDDCLIDAGYDTLKELLQGGATEEEDDDAVPSKRGRDEDDDSDDTDDNDEPTPPRSQKGKKPIPEDDEDDTDSDEDEGSDDTDGYDYPVAARGKKDTKKAEPTADEFGLKKGMRVKYKGEEYDIIKISGDGTSLTLEDDDGEEKRAVSPAEVKTLVKAKAKAADPDDEEDDDDRPTRGKPTPAGKKGSSKDSTDEDEESDDDSELDDEDDEPAPAKKGDKKPTRASDDEDEDDSFEEPDEDDEDASEDDEDSDDEDEPAPVKKGGKKTTTKRR